MFNESLSVITNKTWFSEEPNATDSQSAPREGLSELGYALAATCLFFIMLFGILNNSVVIFVVASSTKLRTPMNCILLNLSLSDFVISSFGTPLSFVSAVRGEWSFGDTLCRAYAFLMTLSGMTSIGTLVAIALERYFIISRSLHCHRLSGGSAALTILLVWLYALSQSLPPLLGWNAYVLERPGIACSLQWEAPGPRGASFVAYLLVLGYFLPLGIIGFCYSRVVWIIRTSPKPAGRGSWTAKAEHKVTLMASGMIFCTILAWTPYAVVSLIASLGHGTLLGPVAAVCPAIFAKTAVIYNPIIYFFFNSQMRDVLLSKLPRRFPARTSATEISLEAKRGITVIHPLTPDYYADLTPDAAMNL